MENQQMAMPAEMAPAGPNPEEMAIYEQMRQQISPQEFSNEMLAGASQIDPQAVAEFTEELRSLDVSPEELDALNDLVDEILANPEQYAQIRQKYLAQGLPDDILPEQFDPNFFAAMNMAVDQMIAAPTGVQAFAKGGIAELKPIAKAIASYGRNGDTMLAHITPAEARMLRRRGGSGTINPSTGLPEFFLKKVFKKIGKAVKKFASSSIGRIVTTVALGFFLGPAAASFLGATSVAGVAAVSGFVGSAGSTLLAGGNLKDALKAGAVGGLTAGAGAGLMGGAEAFAANSASTAGLTPGQAFSGQVDKFTNVFSPGTAAAPTPGLDAAGQAPVPEAGDIASRKVTVDLAGNRVSPMDPINGAPPPAPSGSSAYDLNMQAQQAAANQAAPGNVLTDNVTTSAQRDAFIANQGLGKPSPSFLDQTKQFYNENISPSGIRAAGQQEAMSKTLSQFPGATAEQVMNAPATSALGKAFASNSPGILSTYGPMAAVGLGTMAAFGGFDSKPVQGGEITNSLMKPVTQRIQEGGTQRQMYMQGLPGVVYDDYGAPVFGQSTRLPTYDVPDYNSGGFGPQGQGIMNLPSIYIPPPGSIGSSRVEQPYNNADMYSNLVPRGYADGGTVTDLFRSVLRRDPSSAEIDSYRTQFGDSIDERERALFREAAGPELAAQRASAAELATQQKAARDAVAQQKALRRSQGSGQMYANINAGLSALAPENFPGAPVQLDAAREAGMRADFTGAGKDIDYARVMQEKGYRPEEVAALTGRTFGDINRRYNTALRQDAYAPMLEGQRNAMATQADILRTARGINVPDYSFVTQPPVDVGGPITTMPITVPPVTQPPVTNTQITEYLGANPNLTDAEIRTAMDQFGVGVDQMAAATGLPVDQVQQRYDTASNFNNQNIQDYLGSNPNMTDAQIREAMDQFGVGTAQMAAATGLPLDQVQQRYNTASQYTNQNIQDYLGSNPNMTDAQIRGAMDQFGVGTAQMAAATGLPMDQVQQRYDYAGSTPAPYTPQGNVTGNLFEDTARDVIAQTAATTQPGGYSNQDIQNYLAERPGLTDSQIRLAMDRFGVGAGQMAAATGIPLDQVQQRYNAAGPTRLLNQGGIAALAKGGYPRRNGQINGPGTEKSDSIPAMLSDGEFVMTAKAVRGAGKGNRRAGAKQMYKLMHQLEKNAERG